MIRGTTNTRNSAARIHSSALIIDTHADTPQRFVDEGFDLADPRNGGDLNLATIRQGNLAAEFFSIWVDPTLYKREYARRTLELIDSVKVQAARHPDRVCLVTSARGIEDAHRSHRLAALMGIEGGHSIENSLPLLRQYYDLGVRYMTLTWSNSNDWADSSGSVEVRAFPHVRRGLTKFGEDVVREMNRLGMTIDISHVSDRAFYRAMATSAAPVIASHSCARALCDHHRNMTDDMLRAVARSGGSRSRGGVVQVNFFSGFVSQEYRNAQLALGPRIERAVTAAHRRARGRGREFLHGEEAKIRHRFMSRIPRPPLSALIDHIDHIAEVAGVGHVGLGSDFDGVSGQLPAGLSSPADLPKITRALLERGYSARDCHRILGGNFLRVFRDVERVARRLAA